MAKNLTVGTEVYIPLPILGLSFDHPSAFYRTKVLELSKKGGQVNVSLPGGGTKWVSANTVYRTIQFLVIMIGDYKTERSLLRPLANCVTSFLRIMIPGDQLIFEAIRTPDELKYIWEQYAEGTSHFVVIGHGEQDGLLFGEGLKLDAKKLMEILVPRGEPKIFLSLCCHTGHEKFAKTISESKAFQAFIGPSEGLHGCIGAQFAQTFFSFLFLSKHLAPFAWQTANDSTPIKPIFKYWLRGDETKISQIRKKIQKS
jgi:hypothetical protein